MKEKNKEKMDVESKKKGKIMIEDELGESDKQRENQSRDLLNTSQSDSTLKNSNRADGQLNKKCGNSLDTDHQRGTSVDVETPMDKTLQSTEVEESCKQMNENSEDVIEDILEDIPEDILEDIPEDIPEQQNSKYNNEHDDGDDDGDSSSDNLPISTTNPQHIPTQCILLAVFKITQPTTLCTGNTPWIEHLMDDLYTKRHDITEITSTDSGKTIIHYIDGSFYKGEATNGKRHGLGTMTYSDASVYRGHFDMDNRHGQGKMMKAGVTFFNGYFEENHPVEGLLVFNDDCYYKGEFHRGLPHKKGTYYNRRKTKVWSGHWKAGKMYGKGVYTWDSKFSFTGTMGENGEPHGSGTIYFPTQKPCILGSWDHGKRSGLFTFIFPDKSYCHVRFVDGKMNGECFFYDKSNKKVSRAFASNNFLTGLCRLVFEDQSWYIGYIKDNQYDGIGTYHFNDRISISGLFQNNRRVKSGDDVIND